MDNLSLTASDGVSIALHQWQPVGARRAAVQVVHGMAEHGARYNTLAEALNAAGFVVFASDHRGHGKTAKDASEFGFLGEGIDWTTCVDDLALVRRQIGEEFPRLPVFLLGHSMGSFLAQQAAAESEGDYAGLILSGSYLEKRWLARLGAGVARLERMRLGAHGRSPIFRALTFDSFNRRFAPARTRFDWLSRDHGEVNRYISDPLCGFAPSVQLWIELLQALAAGLPTPAPELPVRIIVGELDPVCSPDPGATRLEAHLRHAGVRRVDRQIYPGARHELFHEANQAEVMRDLIDWLDQILAG